MKNDVKKIISEAFNELYHEMVSEDSRDLENDLNPEEQNIANSLIARAKKLGGASELNHSYRKDAQGRTVPHNERGTAIFNFVIERLIEDYKTSRDPKIKEAIQGAFYPVQGSIFYNSLMKSLPSQGKTNAELEDAITTAYEQNLIQDFDKMVDKYTSGDGRFGAMIHGTLDARARNDLKGFSGVGGGSSQDAIGGSFSQSMDVEDDETGRTLKDKLSNVGLDPDIEFSEFGSSREQKILDVINGWLKNTVSEKQYIAFRELTRGASPADVAEENPELFRNNKDVSRNFAQLMGSEKIEVVDGEKVKFSVPQRISELVSHAFGLENFDIRDIMPKQLKQQFSMDPTFGGGEVKKTKISSKEKLEAQEELKSILMDLGLDTLQTLGVKNKNDYNSVTQIKSIADKLDAMGKESEAENVRRVLGNINKARVQDTGYGDVSRYIGDDGDDYSGMFEGVDIDTLMQRVYKRISK